MTTNSRRRLVKNPSRNVLTRLVGRVRVLPILLVATTAGLMAGSLTSAVMAAPTTASQSSREAHSACAHRAGSPGLAGYEELIEHGWTIGEKNGFMRALGHFAQRVCPQPESVEVEATTFYPKHIDNETVWQDTFRIVVGPAGRHYLVTADLQSLESMTITIKATNGKVVYRSGRINTPEG
jgi:hypothetical protein